MAIIQLVLKEKVYSLSLRLIIKEYIFPEIPTLFRR